MGKLNKFFIVSAIVVILGVVIGVTAYKVVIEHNKNVALVESKYIIEQAKKCYYDGKCNNSKITLQELYDNDYLTRQVNSITKEYYSNDSYIEINGNDWYFISL